MSRALIATCVLLASCGGGGGGDDPPDSGNAPPPPPSPPAPVVATGYLRSPVVAGLRYVSGAQQGVTDAQGRFTYESNTGAKVRFFVGALEIGSIAGRTLVSPFDLQANATDAGNVLRFLTVLDHDADASNGVQISTALDAVAQTWRSLSFTAENFEPAVAPYLSDVASVDSGTRVLPSAADSIDTIRATYECLYAGLFTGSYSITTQSGSLSSSQDNGRVALVAVTPDAQAFGLAYETSSSPPSLFIGGRTPAALDPAPDFTAAAFSIWATLSAQFTSPDSIFGFVANASGISESFVRVSGSASMSRNAPDSLIAYRFATMLTAQGTRYLLALDFDASNNVRGTLVVANTTVTTYPITGTVQDDHVTATAGDGRFSLQATFERAGTQLRGTLRDGAAPAVPLGPDSLLTGCAL